MLTARHGVFSQNQTDALGEDRTRIDHVKSSAASSNHGLNKELENTQKYCIPGIKLGVGGRT